MGRLKDRFKKLSTTKSPSGSCSTAGAVAERSTSREPREWSSQLADPDPVSNTVEPNTGSHDQALLSSSDLWKKALEKVKEDPGWKKYLEIVGKNTLLTSTNIDSPDGVVEMVKPSSQMLAEALILRFSFTQQVVDITNEDEKRMRSKMSHLSRSFRKHNVNLDTACGFPGRNLFTNLVNISKIRANNFDIAIMVACLVNDGAHALVPIYIPIHMPSSDFDTVFHWVLFWRSQFAIEDLAPSYLYEQWPKQMWSYWLYLAVESEFCSSKLVHVLLQNGADPLIARADRKCR